MSDKDELKTLAKMFAYSSDGPWDTKEIPGPGHGENDEISIVDGEGQEILHMETGYYADAFFIVRAHRMMPAILKHLKEQGLL